MSRQNEHPHSKDEEPSDTPQLNLDFRQFLRYESARLRAIRLLRLESALLVLLVFYLGISGILKTVVAPGALIGEVIFGLLGAGALYVSSNGFAQRKAYGRAPAVLANLITLGVCYFMFNGGLILVAVPLSLLALATFFSALFGFSGGSTNAE